MLEISQPIYRIASAVPRMSCICTHWGKLRAAITHSVADRLPEPTP